ncbi:GTPase-activating protein and VPS9 domain-containing protein 1-like protein [Dinothrombium tinctorium]|uniref:Receptor-mediated endocytosis protein 6 homolog n=1 Tax=Dinothrombium tinctorium TaxID=1965070 RepID=A0A443RKU1_9ACAR|nr:GTPase-activating protein and VPS9 domain-containing protein 1-like protein [Dinothrombium tinctorium]
MKPKNRSSISKVDIIELANHLRLEHLFITSEKRQIQKLNENIFTTSERLFHLSWIIRKQRLNLERLVLLQKDANPGHYCFVASALENATFVDSFKKLSSFDSYFSDLMLKLRKNPKLVAQCLIEGESSSMEMTTNVIPILMSSLYCDCLLQEDKILVLHLLRELLIHELSNCDNPRRLLRQGVSAFSKFYKLFSECLTSSKLFLTVSLREAVINLLIEDDLFLDIDPQRAAQRFSREERIRHFGQEKSPSYDDNLSQYKSWIISKLSSLVMKFIDGIQSNIHCFPESLCWLVKQINSTLKSSEKVEEREIWFICADFVFGYFICHAIVNPELYGIVDIHVNHIARFNLMQVAQIIQALALSKWESTDPKLDDLYSKFPKDCLSSVLDFLLIECTNELPAGSARSMQEITRTCTLITEGDLHFLMKFLFEISKSCKSSETKQQICDLLNNISEAQMDKMLSSNESSQNCADELTPNDSRSKKNLLTRVTRRAKGENFNESHLHDPISSQKCSKTEVLVIPLNQFRDYQSPGMLSEEKVLSMELQKRHTKVRMNLEANNSRLNEETESVISSSIVGENVEKKPRFSQDQESVGTSDNLEAVSEAASNQSVASSLDSENENENDNFSDMVSANVSSGRGTPNVSGRETPSSQSSQDSSDDGNDTTAVGNENSARNAADPRINRDTLNAIPIQQPNRPNNREDIDGKFGKFDCKPCATIDETKSLLSDTWSTDVLASDSEALEQSENAAGGANQASGVNFLVTPGFPGQLIQSTLDASETASQSDAWSTDVLTSDTERLQEFDMEETGSITRSDDSNLTRSELEVEDTLASGAVGGDNGVLQNFIYFDEDFSKDGTIKHGVHRRSKAQEAENKAVAEPSNEDIKPIVNCDKQCFNSGATSPNETSTLSTNMQTLGRLSFDVRRLPFTDDDPVSFILPYLRERASSEASDAERLINQRSSITELLSVDFTNASKKETRVSAVSTDSNFESLNLIEFEKEIAVADNVQKIDNGKTRNKPDLLTGDSSQNIQLPSTRFSCTSASSGSTIGSCTDVNNSEADNSSLKMKENVKGDVDEPRESFMSTGAIPKVSNGNKNRTSHARTNNDEEAHRSVRKGFFKLQNFKTTFKEKMKSFKDKKLTSLVDTANHVDVDISSNQTRNETSDEILEKYRERKEVTTERNCIAATNNFTESNVHSIVDDEDESLAFENTKKILRYVLSTVDVQMLPLSTNNSITINLDSSLCLRQNSELMKFLKALLAEAKHMQNSAQIVAIQEAIRFVDAFDEKSSQKLFWSLREDYQRRSPYIAYLTRCRQGLLSTLAQFDNIMEHLLRDKDICNYNLIAACVRFFLERRERAFQFFIQRFQRLTVADEKAQLVEKFLLYLYNAMESDSIWQVASDEQLEIAKAIIERYVMSQIYIYALYPNGDGDMLRDQVLHKHMQHLAKFLSPDHKDLRIPKMYHCECPWPVAQEQILTINAYKTPRDKVLCVVRCCTIIMNLLSLVNEKSVPSADDLIPVLVYVLIKANPAALLSNVQYVNSFYGKLLEGEEAYWWTQFCSAVEFIKTMV